MALPETKDHRPYTNKYVSDIPLKRPQETFVDDPSALDEVSIVDLEFDFAHGIKDINRLHIYHAIAVFKTVLDDLILLASDRELFAKFRAERLDAYCINIEELASGHFEQKTGFHDDDLPLPLDTPHDTVPFLEANTPSNPLELSPDLELCKQESADELLTPSPSEPDFLVADSPHDTHDGTQDDCGAFISTESLIQTTSLEKLADPITTHSNERLKKEVAYHMAPKIKQQADHLLRCFGLAKVPPITISQFLARIKTYLPLVSVSVYIHSAYMLFKLCVLLDVVQLTPLNVYRFILALIRCLTKKLEDIYQKQKNFATVGGVALLDLCKIEISFLYLLNFKLVVSEYILNHFLTQDFLALRTFCKHHFPELAAA